QDAKAVRLSDGDLQAVDRLRVFAADVNVALGRADGVAGDGHALEHPVRVALQLATVHEGAGVTLVGLADDELPVTARLGDHPPLDAGRVARPAPAAEPAPRDHVHDLGRVHLAEDVVQRVVAARGNVRLDPLRLNHAAVLQHHGNLSAEEWAI